MQKNSKDLTETRFLNTFSKFWLVARLNTKDPRLCMFTSLQTRRPLARIQSPILLQIRSYGLLFPAQICQAPTFLARATPCAFSPSSRAAAERTTGPTSARPSGWRMRTAPPSRKPWSSATLQPRGSTASTSSTSTTATTCPRATSPATPVRTCWGSSMWDPTTCSRRSPAASPSPSTCTRRLGPPSTSASSPPSRCASIRRRAPSSPAW
mmetsp:Transcript_1243/g.3296  ORF Transcript_1243/g.3296 Transcript_1243/m.3296 type:complete len:210 (+) Transcript_1243:526-1155(+)